MSIKDELYRNSYNNRLKKTLIKEILIEDDTVKQINIDDKTMLYYNLYGMPLIEIFQIVSFL